MKLPAIFVLLMFSGVSLASEMITLGNQAETDAPEAASEISIPLSELAFVDRIGQLGKATILEQLGEPSKTLDIVLEDSGEITASIWHYNYLNTSEEGEYYKTTELSFLGDRVVNVVFSMTDENEAMDPSQATGYLPTACPSC